MSQWRRRRRAKKAPSGMGSGHERPFHIGGEDVKEREEGHDFVKSVAVLKCFFLFFLIF